MQITLWQSYTGPRPPSSSAGGKSGLGWTQAQASEQAHHCVAQARWEKFRRIVVHDYDPDLQVTPADAMIVRVELGYLEDFWQPSEIQAKALRFLQASHFASAWTTLHPYMGDYEQLRCSTKSRKAP